MTLDRGPDRGCGPNRSFFFPVFLGPSRVRLQSFFSLATGPQNTTYTLPDFPVHSSSSYSNPNFIIPPQPPVVSSDQIPSPSHQPFPSHPPQSFSSHPYNHHQNQQIFLLFNTYIIF